MARWIARCSYACMYEYMDRGLKKEYVISLKASLVVLSASGERERKKKNTSVKSPQLFVR